MFYVVLNFYYKLSDNLRLISGVLMSALNEAPVVLLQSVCLDGFMDLYSCIHKYVPLFASI